MENNLNKKEWIKTGIFIGFWVLVALISFFWLAKLASDEGNFTWIYNALDEKRTTVTQLMGVTAGSSTAITMLPGDAGTPIAEQLADLSGYFIFIMALVCFEKWMVTIAGTLAFKILIPVACLLFIVSKLFSKDGKLAEAGIKIALVGLMMFAIVPASVVLTAAIDDSYQASIQQMIEEAENENAQIQNTIGEEEDDTIIEKLFKKVQGGVTGTLKKFENTLNQLTEAIAVLLVTSCAIPLGVLIFFLWLIKLITGVSLSLPWFKASKLMPKKGIDLG